MPVHDPSLLIANYTHQMFYRTFDRILRQGHFALLHTEMFTGAAPLHLFLRMFFVNVDQEINWVHQPIFLLPDPAVALEHDGIGGIYSGSAVVVIDAVSGRPKRNVYYTDSLNDRVPWQFQRAVTTMNGIMPDRAATTLIPDVPPGVGLMPDFRDPSVFMGPDGRWKMVLSSKDNQGGVVLLYETSDKQAMANWRFLNVLHRDSRVNTSVVECAALLALPAPVGGRTLSTVPLWVLLYGQLDAFDPRTGRRNMSPAFVGTFDGRQFRALFEQELDFATGSYAFQGFYEQSLDQTLMIGWLANWRDYDAETKSDFPTSMTVPRQMLLSRDGTALLTPPIDLRSLRMRRLDDGHLLQSGQTVQLPTGTAEIRLIIRQEVLQLHDATVQLEVDHPKTETAPGVLIAPEGLEILPGKSHSTAPQPKFTFCWTLAQLKCSRTADDGPGHIGSKVLTASAPSVSEAN
ncbi:hypothetical protein niasHT_022108 [Heterodera trifolii]|uniref:beta-fructofuranosidase n=1 Tax=Heterodera trifolii TaxID=157864 RepID=A0ABD2KNT9_9BILA